MNKIDSAPEYSFFGFTCLKCNYRCRRRSDLHKHFKTKKHLNNIYSNEDNNPTVSNTTIPYNKTKSKKLNVLPTVSQIIKSSKNIQNSNNHECVCGKKYKHMSSLCKHKKKCEQYINMSNMNTSTTPFRLETNNSDLNMDCVVKEVNPDDKSEQSEEKQDTSSMKILEKVSTLITEQAKRTDELKDMLEKQNKQIEEISEKAAVTNITTNNTVNNKFNLNLFLNSECKEAVNIMDFIDMLPVNTRDLENIGDFGYVEGITRVLLNGLHEMDIRKRPIHCSDVKRESIYIKDNNMWEKDNVHGDKMKKVIKYVAHKNVKQLPEWQRENPRHRDYSSGVHHRYMNIINNAMGGSSDQENEQLQNKIIKRVAGEVTIPKNSTRFKMIYDDK